MGRWTRFSGIVGAVLVLFGILGGLVVGFGADNLIQILMVFHILGGLGLIVFWFVSVGFAEENRGAGLLRGRAARYGANLVAYTVVFVGLLTALNFLVNRHDKRLDLTEQGVYSLASVSASAMAELKKPLKIVAFKAAQLEDEQGLTDLLALLSSANKAKISTEIVDPRAKPHLVDSYGMKQGNLVYLEYGEGDAKAVSRINEVSEQALVNAVVKLTRGDAKKIYYVVGHNEPELESAEARGAKEFAAAVADEHLTLEPIVLAEKQAVPDDAAALIVAAPRKKLADQERAMIIAYAEKGGRLILLTDPRAPSDVRDIAAHFGIKVGSGIVVDQVQRLFAAPALGIEPMVRSYAMHPITAGFSSQDVAIFNQAASVSAAETKDDKATYLELAKTGPQAWEESDLASIFDASEPSAQKDAADSPGPISLALVYEKKLEQAGADPKEKSGDKFERTTRIAVFGDSDWITNGSLQQWAHRDLILNSINWALGEEGGVTIGQRSFREPKLTPISNESYLVMLASSFVIPELIFLTGLVIWWRRRTAFA